MHLRTLPVLLLPCLLLASPGAATAPLHPLTAILQQTQPEASHTERQRLFDAFDKEVVALAATLAKVGPADTTDVSALLLDQVQARLETRHRAGLTTSLDDVERSVIGFEAYRARSFVTGGVYPKRYFGYLDAQGDTAALELRVVRAVRASTDACNAWLAKHDIAWRVTDREIAVTWIAEGGALLLGDLKHNADRVHAVYGIGLDDIAHGFKELPGLVGELDAAAGTRVEEVPAWRNGNWTLTRDMTLEESVVGTSIMWVWEKRIAERKLREAGRPALHTYDQPTQFILGSLVYNSGILHSPSRPAQVQGFTLANHLAGLADKHNGKRVLLPVEPPAENLARLMVTRQYPEQWTSWIALYHILQRFGGYEGLSRYSGTFDGEGRLVMERWERLAVRLEAEAEAEAKAAEEARAERERDEAAATPAKEGGATLRGCGCMHGGHPAGLAWGLVGVLGMIALRRRR